MKTFFAELPRLEDLPEAPQEIEPQAAPPQEDAVDEDQYAFFDVPEDGDAMFALPEEMPKQ